MVLQPKEPCNHKDSSLLASPHSHTGRAIIFFTALRLVSSRTRWNQPPSQCYHHTRWNLSSGKSHCNHKLRLDLETTSPIPSFATHWTYAPIEQVAPPKHFLTPCCTHFKGDSDSESHLKHFKSVMILYKTEDALMCKVFTITLRGAAQDWFHTLPSESISSFKELAFIFTKEYTSYRTIKKKFDHLFNLCKKHDESLRDYIKRFKAEKANIVGYDDRITSLAFKKGLPAEHLYNKLTIAPNQTLEEVFTTVE
ncbi:unnamed protein product, partial [Prunus brigantina]